MEDDGEGEGNDDDSEGEAEEDGSVRGVFVGKVGGSSQASGLRRIVSYFLACLLGVLSCSLSGSSCFPVLLRPV